MPATDAPESTPSLRFLGGAGTVTGSRFLIESGPARLLVDCGMFQGLKQLRLRNWKRLPVEAGSIDAVVVTHAHVDHIGWLPALVAAGFRGPVLASPHTVDLAHIVLPDAAHLQEEEAAYANRRGYSKHHPALPLYTSQDAQRALDLLRAVPFGDEIDAAPGLAVGLQPAGHILGSAGVRVRLLGTGSGTPDTTVFCSGDVGRPVHPLLAAPPPPPPSDVVLVESTYGDRRHGRSDEAMDRLADAITRTAARGGVVVVPAFAVDRTEVLLLALRRLVEDGRVPRLPVYADSPMALRVLDVYRRAIARHSPELRPGLGDGGGDPFDPGDLHEAHHPEDSMAINDLRGPMIVVSASGMATGGRVLHHLARRLTDRRNTVLLVGFQAAGTRGRSLADGARAIRMLGRDVPVRAEVVVVDGFSVHADGDELVEWLGRTQRPKAAYVVHGEPGASATLAGRLVAELGWPARVPDLGETVPLP